MAMDGMHIAAGAIAATGTGLDVTANNLANVNTNGFRAGTTRYATGPGGEGVTANTATTTGSAPVAFTGQQLDLALTDGSWFAVRQGNRLAFTQDSSFTIDGQGRIANQNGALLDPAITVPQNATGIGVGRDGAVTAILSDGTTQQIGAIQPVRFANAAGLESIGNNLSVPTPASGPATRTGATSVQQGAVTLSNTDLATEMVNLIVEERTVSFNAATVRTEDEMLGTILDLKR